MRFPYRRLNTNRPVLSLGGVSWRDYPLCFTGVLSGGSSTSVVTLIDSGSDDVVFPIDVARKLGVDLSQAPPTDARAVGGQQVAYHYVRLTLRLSDGIEHCQWDAIVGVSPLPMRWGLLGRAGFFPYFDVSFLDTTHETVVVPNASFPGQYARP